MIKTKYVDKLFYEISEGYLISKLYDKSQHTTQLNLSNPLNNDEIPFPECCCDHYLFQQRYSQIEEYGLACAHSRQDSAELLCCQLGQKYWCQQLCELEWGDDERTYDWVILKGMLFSFERYTRVTKVTDIGTGSLVYVVPPVEDHVTVKSSTFLEAGGDILGVFVLNNEPANFMWEIRCLDVNESGSSCWVKVENIGNHALFMDVYGVFMLKANELAGIKANCMYHLYEKDENSYDVNLYEDFVEDSETTFEVERIDIQTGAKEFCQCLPPLGNRVCWFVPNLRRLRWN